MKIAHEAPLSIMMDVMSITDYDYFLVHLFEESRHYKEIYQKSKELKRLSILDNSLYELGEAFSLIDFFNKVNELKPDEYIIPDVFNDSQKTMANIDSWFINRFDKIQGCKSIGVVQGENFNAFLECHDYVKNKCNKIALPFRSPVYEYLAKDHPIVEYRMMYGRQILIDYLVKNNLISDTKPYHLLGCYLPQEFLHYENYLFIETIDTSNPVLHGLLGEKYQLYGLHNKSFRTINSMFLDNVSKENLNIVMYNIRKFKEINKII